MQFANRELMKSIMKKHNGMRPQDIVVLLKIISMQNQEWRNIDIANALNLSASEVSEALNRSRIAKLLDGKKKSVNPNSLKEFLIYGLKYVFPVEPGAIVRGMPTAHSAPPISEKISQSGELYVWPYVKGIKRGQAIEPLYKTVPEIVQKDKSLYELLALTDSLRVGRAREIKLAKEELENRMKYAF